jgi:hypothetical protein
LDLHAFDRDIAAASSADSCVGVIVGAAENFGFSVTRLQIAGEVFSAKSAGPTDAWQVRIPLEHGDFIELIRDAGNPSAAGSSGPFLDSVRTGLAEKLPTLQSARGLAVQNSRTPAW